MVEKNFRFPRRERLQKRAEYLAVYRAGEKVHTPYFVLYALRNGLGHHRLGVTVSKKIGKAVTRSRVKRRLREIFRTHDHFLSPSFDLVLNARRTAGLAAYAELREHFAKAVSRRLRGARE